MLHMLYKRKGKGITMKAYQKGKTFFACGQPVVVRLIDGETHIFSTNGEKLSTEDMSFGILYGGGEGLDLECVSVTQESGHLQALYGGGIDDTVKHVEITVTGGVIRSEYVGGGMAKKVGTVNINLNHVSARAVITGSEAVDAVVDGDATVTLNSGVVLNLKCGGGEVFGDVTVTVNGGRLEKQIIDDGIKGNLNISLPEDIFVKNSNDGQFPMLPEHANITYTPAVGYDDIKLYKKNKDEFFTRDDKKAEIRFFELRDPALKKEDTPYPQFIGDCILITLPEGKTMLVDTGFQYSWDELKTSLDRLGITAIDYLVITHLHGDHGGNLLPLVDSFIVDTVVIPDVYAGADVRVLPQINEVMKRASLGQQKVMRVAEGDAFRLGDARFEVLNPEFRGFCSATLNDTSITLKMTYFDNTVLLTGDITQSVELRLVEKYGNALKCDVLKSAHHAIVSQNHYKFIDACSPRYTVIHNLRENGVFARVTLYSLENVNKLSPDSIYLTGRDGAVKLTLDGTRSGIKIWTMYDKKEVIKQTQSV